MKATASKRSLSFFPYEENLQQIREYTDPGQVVKEAIHLAILSLREEPKPLPAL